MKIHEEDNVDVARTQRQRSKMVSFVAIVNTLKPLTIAAKLSYNDQYNDQFIRKVLLFSAIKEIHIDVCNGVHVGYREIKNLVFNRYSKLAAIVSKKQVLNLYLFTSTV